jgi:outer membrane protein TolC
MKGIMKEKMKRIGLVGAVLLCFTAILPVKAQTGTHFLPLNEAIEAALKGNKQLITASIDEKIAVSDYRKTDAVFLPQVNVSYSVMATNDPLNVFGFKLQQQSVKAEDFNPTLLNNPNSLTNFNANLEVQMPLLNLDQMYMRKAASVQKEAVRYGTVRMKEYVVFEVKKAYLQLQLAYREKAVLEEALATSSDVYASVEHFFAQGLIRKSDVLNAKVHVSGVETNLEQAKSAVANASDYLSLLMGHSTGTVYQVEEPVAAVLGQQSSVSDLRPDFQAMEKAVAAVSLMTKSAGLSLVPRLNAFGSYQLNDKRIASFGSDNYLVGVRLSWTLFNGNQSKYNVRSSKLTGIKLQEQLNDQKMKAQLEYSKTNRDLDNIAFELRKQNDMVEQATEALRIIKDRFSQGLEKTADVLIAQTQLSGQQLNQARSIYKQHLTSAYMEFLTSNESK